MSSPKSIKFYSSVPDKALFSKSGFYILDIAILEDLGYKVTTSNRFLDFLSFWKYDISFIYFYRWGLFPAIISRLFGKSVFFTGGIDNLDKDFVGQNSKAYSVQKYFVKACNLFSTKNIIVSKSDWNNVANEITNIRNKSIIIPHAIKIDQFLYDYDLDKKENIITTIAWMGKGNVIRKGIDKSLYVLRAMLDMGLDYTFYILGKDGGGKEHLLSIINDLDLNNNVKFTGFISEEEKINILQKSKYYFQLSKFEGFGIAAIEGLAAANIVVHTGKGGLKDTISKFGIQVNINDSPESVASKINLETKVKESKDNVNNSIAHLKNNFSFDMRKREIGKILKQYS